MTYGDVSCTTDKYVPSGENAVQYHMLGGFTFCDAIPPTYSSTNHKGNIGSSVGYVPTATHVPSDLTRHVPGSTNDRCISPVTGSLHHPHHHATFTRLVPSYSSTCQLLGEVIVVSDRSASVPAHDHEEFIVISFAVLDSVTFVPHTSDLNCKSTHDLLAKTHTPVHRLLAVLSSHPPHPVPSLIAVTLPLLSTVTLLFVYAHAVTPVVVNSQDTTCHAVTVIFMSAVLPDVAAA